MIRWLKRWWKKHIVSTTEEFVDIWICENCKETVCTEEMRDQCVERWR